MEGRGTQENMAVCDSIRGLHYSPTRTFAIPSLTMKGWRRITVPDSCHQCLVLGSRASHLLCPRLCQPGRCHSQTGGFAIPKVQEDVLGEVWVGIRRGFIPQRVVGTEQAPQGTSTAPGLCLDCWGVCRAGAGLMIHACGSSSGAAVGPFQQPMLWALTPRSKLLSGGDAPCRNGSHCSDRHLPSARFKCLKGLFHLLE